MLIKNFYTVLSIKEEGSQKFIAKVQLNKNHEIFKGHFPERPIVPGVCMMQIVKELTETILKRNVILKTASKVKFIQVVTPQKQATLDLSIQLEKQDDIEVKIKSVIFIDSDKPAMKMNAIYGGV